MTARFFLHIFLVIACTVSIGASMDATAQGGRGMVLNRSIVVFKPDQAPREDVAILNEDEENLYVKIDILEIRNPGTEEEDRVKITDPSQSKLVVTPNRLVIPPLGRKTVRLVNLEPSDEERIYRINVTPVLPPLENPESSVVRIVVAYQLLVIIQPQQPVEDLQVSRNDRNLVFENRGNTNILIGEGTQCDEKGGNCLELPTKRIYAGNRFEVELTRDTPVSYKLTASDVTRQAVYE